MYPTPSFQSPTAIHVAMTTSQCQQPSRVGSGVRILPTTAMPSYSLMELLTTQQHNNGRQSKSCQPRSLSNMSRPTPSDSPAGEAGEERGEQQTYPCGCGGCYCGSRSRSHRRRRLRCQSSVFFGEGLWLLLCLCDFDRQLAASSFGVYPPEYMQVRRLRDKRDQKDEREV